jgi:hypothetical protein
MKFYLDEEIETPVPTDRRTAWCAGLMFLPWIPTILSMSAFGGTSPGLGRWGPFLILLASLAAMLVIDVICIAVLVNALAKDRIKTPSLAKTLIWIALLLWAWPLLYLANA